MTILRRSASAIALVVAFALPAAAQDAKPKAAGVAVSTPWARATPGGAKVGAAFLEMSAPAGAADTLKAAKSPVAGVVELHTHTQSNGVMQMRRVDDIPVPAGSKVVMKPGGFHIMLMDLKKPLKEGEAIDLTLVFEKAGEVKVTVPVLKAGSPGPGGAAPANSGGHGGAHGKH